MRHYEIVLMIHPDKSDDVISMINNYTEIIKTSNGKIHRLENWGRKQLAYTINKLQKVHYVLMNLEISQNTLEKLKSDFLYNDNIIRNMILRMKKIVNDPSPMLKLKEEKKENREDLAK